ncbi:MAG: response regulator transcription factor [FCB group bacterium]|jgi:DNA-binding NarL/FixJ family response regulator|nr:response regulator transcription factor [FCB group bacterium]
MDLEPWVDSTPIRILVVDDHPAVCQGLGLLLESERIFVCGEAGGLNEALACVDRCRPDLALVDLSLGDEDGMVLVKNLHARGLPSLVYSMYEDGRHVEGAFAAGALGYVTKREIRGVLVQAIREVAAGRRFVSPRAAVALASRIADARPDDGYVDLSSQERQVYRLLGEGQGTGEIAAALGISVRTVESYYARILVKLGLDGMRDLRRHAIGYLRTHTS